MIVTIAFRKVAMSNWIWNNQHMIVIIYIVNKVKNNMWIERVGSFK
jgi:hypothetical protein